MVFRAARVTLAAAVAVAVAGPMAVAHADDPQLCEIEVELRIAIAAGGAVKARCHEMVLIENSSGRWEEMRRFALGAS